MGNARGKARDARRVADVKTIQNSLELVYNDAELYPTTAYAGQTGWHLCEQAKGFVASTDACGTKEYLKVPLNPSPGGSAYTYATVAAGTGYTLTFTLENATGGLAAGLRTATPTGIQ